MVNHQDRLELASHIRECILKISDEQLLLEQDLNERTIAHRFAIHLENTLDEHGWLQDYPHVDVEYNRIGEFDDPDPKRLDDDLQDLLNALKDLTHHENGDPSNRLDEILEKLQNRLIYPDVIVHERGQQRNLIVLELKKGTSSEITSADKFDHMKLTAFTDGSGDLGYRFGVFLKLRVGSHSEKFEDVLLNSTWFERGEAIGDNPLEN